MPAQARPSPLALAEWPRARRLSQMVQLTSTRLAFTKSYTREELFAEEATRLDQRDMRLVSSGRLGARADGGVAVFYVDVTAVWPPDRDDKTALLYIQIRRALAYGGIPDDATDDELGVFARTQAVFNAWPYLRADVQLMSVLIGVGAIVLPLLQVNALLGDDDQEKPAPTKSKKKAASPKTAKRKRRR